MSATREWLSKLGVTEDAERELGIVLKHAPMTNEDIAIVDQIEDVDPVILKRRLEWGERLGLVSLVDGEWSFNSLVGRLLGGSVV